MTGADSTSRPGLGPDARRRLQDELADLRDRRRELVAALQESDSVGDRADAAETLEMRDELVWADEQIAEIVARLAGAEPAGDSGGLPDGAEVTLRFEDGTEQTLRVAAFPEEVPEGAEETSFTVHSPLGRALAGHRPGDTVSYSTPDGPVHVRLIDLRLP
ncbi:MAG TPA: GreA/GreB family elongation factor [Pseudonocardiaceae bacterium]|jgi:transcription elongation GreA/GreB family factor